MKPLFAPEAAEDMENIYSYYAEYNENYAVELYNHIIEEAELLRCFPYKAPREQLLEENPEEYRSLIIRHSYKLVYFVENDTINVVAVFDCRQNPEKLKEYIRKIKR